MGILDDYPAVIVQEMEALLRVCFVLGKVIHAANTGLHWLQVGTTDRGLTGSDPRRSVGLLM